MEDDFEPKSTSNVASWIVSLAVSVTCCAILFVIFAGYLTDIKKNIAIENTRLEQMAAHQDQLLAEIRALHHIGTLGNAPSAPTAVTPAGPTPATSTPPLAPVQTPDVPPPAAPAVSPQAPVPPTQTPAAAIPEQVSPQPVAPQESSPGMPPVSVPSMPPAKQ